MPAARGVVETIRDIVDHMEAGWTTSDASAQSSSGHYMLQSVADYYRLQVDNNAEVFHAELPQYNGQYIAIEQHSRLMELPDEFDVPAYVVRDIVSKFRKWAFLRGFKKGDYEHGMVEACNCSDAARRSIISLMNTRIDAGQITPQDAFLALSLGNMAYDRSTGKKPALDSVDEALALIEVVEHEVDSIIDENQDEEGAIDWNQLGGTLDIVYNELHHEGLKSVARRKAAREIQNGETTPEEILDS